jgi:two-component system chemotaxis response regulator CheB
MPKIKVLAVDDAVVMRKIITEAVSREPDMEVVGVAANGKIALDKIAQLTPDVITLDMEMPDMDGLSMLKLLRKTHTKLPVIMFSSLTRRGAEITLEALACGASDYVTKPANVGSLAECLTALTENLIPKIRIHCRHVKTETILPPKPSASATVVDKSISSFPVSRNIQPAVATPDVVKPGFALREPPLQQNTFARQPLASVQRSNGASRGKVEIVCLGTSTGGPNALADLFKTIHAGFPVPIVIVQHMPPMFTAMLAERLGQTRELKFFEGAEGMRIEAGSVYIAPGGHHMDVVRTHMGTTLRIHQGQPENSCRPAVDVLFRSVVAAYGGNVLGVILTGMGQDGMRGCELIKEQNGQVVIQDEPTSVVWGMPGSVAQAGYADCILPLEKIGDEITRRTFAGRSLASRTGKDDRGNI